MNNKISRRKLTDAWEWTWAVAAYGITPVATGIFGYFCASSNRLVNHRLEMAVVYLMALFGAYTLIGKGFELHRWLIERYHQRRYKERKKARLVEAKMGMDKLQ